MMTIPGCPIIRFEDVWRAFDGIPVLQGVTVDIFRGSTTFIVGPSGCGKSVLMKMIVGMDRPDRGLVAVDGVDVASLDRAGLNALRRNVAFVPQHPALFDSLDVAGNIALPLVHHGICGHAQAAEVAAGLLDGAGLGHRLHAMPAALNQSDRKIVSILRSMAMKPDCLILDEPTTGLDAPARLAVDGMIRDIGRPGGADVTLVVISHDMKATMSIADRIVFLYNGGIRLDGTRQDFATAAGLDSSCVFTGDDDPGSARSSMTDPVVAQFLSGTADGPMTSGE